LLAGSAASAFRTTTVPSAAAAKKPTRLQRIVGGLVKRARPAVERWLPVRVLGGSTLGTSSAPSAFGPSHVR